MIKVELLGRLGNQMFQYAFAYATAATYKTGFLIAPTAPFEPARYFRLDAYTNFFYTLVPLNRYLIKLYCIAFNKRYDKNKVIEDQSRFVETANNTNYQGYFQSEQYFLSSLLKIEKAFTVKKKWRNFFNDKYGTLIRRKKIIVIHVRRTDYIDFGKKFLGDKDLSLPFSYYNNCLKKIENIESYELLCISDDIDFVKDNLKIDKAVSFESNDMITDFQLLQHADIAIIANSTFAWWAAYLNKKAKKIFAPKYWLGFKVSTDYPKGIMPSKFTAVDVY